MLDAFGLPEQAIARAKELGRTAMAITDHGSMSGHPTFEKAASKAGIKPIFGEEFYIVGDLELNTQKKSHLTVLAKNQVGYRNLIKLASESYRLGFYYKPTIDSKLLQQYGEGLVIFSGCTLSPTSRMILGGDSDKAEATVKTFRGAWGNDFYLEVQPTDFEDCRVVNAEMKRLSKLHGIPLVVTNDVHYPEQGQHDLRRILHSIRNRQRVEEITDMGETHYQLSYEELLRCSLLGGVDDVIAEAAECTLKIADECSVHLEKAALLRFPLPEGWDSKEEYLRSLIVEGMKFRGLDSDEYRERVEYEFGLVVEKNYVDYFLIISDMIVWAKRSGILVGPARGSSAGSLICYLLRITEVDPLKWGLMFERFIDITRMDLPDIDVDFEDERRHLIKEYLAEKYGADRVASLATFATFRAKNSLDDVGKSLTIPKAKIDLVKSRVFDRAKGDSRLNATLADTLTTFEECRQVLEEYPELKFASDLEGQYRSMGTHAAGVVISDEPLDKNVPIYWRQGEAFAGYDYAGCSYLDLVKVDILGLRTLTRLRLIVDAVGMTFDELYTLPFDDEEVLDGFRRMDLLGIFQFEGGATNSVLQSMTDVTGINEVVDVGALSRPGPLYGGSTSLYIGNRRLGADQKKRNHPTLDRYTADTQYQIIYQEQVLKIAREIGNLSWKDTADLRRGMSRSLGQDFFAQFRMKFSQGALELHQIPLEEGGKLFDMMETFGSWAFNKSHSVSYGILSYWTMWMKVRYPHQFYWSLLSTEGNADSEKKLLSEYVRRGGVITSPRINDSSKSWALSEKYGGLLAGFTQLPGIGEKVAEELVAHQPYASLDDLLARVNKRVVNRAKIQALVDSCCLDELEGDEDFMGIREEIAYMESLGREKMLRDSREVGTMTLVGVMKKADLRSLDDPGVIAYRNKEEARSGKTWETKKPELRQWVTLLLEDESGTALCIIRRYDYPRLKAKFWKCAIGDLIQVKAERTQWQNEKSPLGISDIKVLRKKV